MTASALGWLASSSGLELERIRCDPAAVSPQGGSEPILPDAVCRTYVRVWVSQSV